MTDDLELIIFAAILIAFVACATGDTAKKDPAVTQRDLRGAKARLIARENSEAKGGIPPGEPPCSVHCSSETADIQLSKASGVDS